MDIVEALLRIAVLAAREGEHEALNALVEWMAERADKPVPQPPKKP